MCTYCLRVSVSQGVWDRSITSVSIPWSTPHDRVPVTLFRSRCPSRFVDVRSPCSLT